MSGREALRRRDVEARRLAQREFASPLALEAGAGTGKTAVLVARIVAWALGPGWERAGGGRDADTAGRVWDGVVALTFTEAAAGEMAERVGGALGRVAQGGGAEGVDDDVLPPPLLRVSRARALLAALDRLTACTLHAWCRRLLAAYPLEAGVHPRLEIDADGAARARVVREVLEARLPPAYTDPCDPDLLALAREGVGPSELEAALLAQIESGLTAAALADDPLAGPRIQDLVDDGRARAAELLERGAALAALAAARTRATRAALSDTAECLTGADPSPAGLEALGRRLGALWTGSPGNGLRAWARGGFSAGERAALGPAAGDLARAAERLRSWLRHTEGLRPALLRSARSALAPLLGAVEAELRARGIATYDALLRDARDLLARHPPVLARLRRGIDQLLVDEFQDTDATQCEIVRRVALEGAPDERPGLFIVGDPKQSIYGWRRADLAAYEGFVAALERAGGARHSLFQNFRSGQGILDEVERCVAPVMCERAGLQPRFEPLVAAPTAPREGAVEHWVAWARDAGGGADPRPSFAEASELEARALARDLWRARRERGLSWSRVGLLFRARTELEPYLTALREAGIPYAIEGDRSYYRRREVIEAAALVRAVIDPDDHVSLLAWLRSAGVGLPDAALLPLWRRRFPELASGLEGPDDVARLDALGRALRDVASELPSDVPGLDRVRGWERSACAGLETLAELRGSFARDAPDVFVERLRELTWIEATEAARYLGPYRVANLERFLRRLAEDLSGSDGDPRDLLRALRRRVAQAEEEEEARPHEALEDAVEVRTIHQAKGLDYDCVYLLQTHKRSAPGADAGRPCGELDGRCEYRLFGAATPGFGRLAERQAEVAQAEQVRLLYVALTRARRRLVVAGLRPVTPERAGPERAASHAELLAARAGPDLAELWAELSARGDAHAEAHGARWVFPALAAVEPEPGGIAATAAELASPERIAADAERLEAARRAAAERAARPYAAPATAAEESLHAREPADRDGERAGAARDVAAAAGTAVHRALERFDLGADPERELEVRLRELPRLVDAGTGAADEAVAAARDVLERFARGPLLPKLRALAPSIVARELPFVAPPGAAGPVGAVLGAIDLVYRDPATGEWVVADFKTDRASGAADLRRRAAAYAAQGDAYTEAVRSALGRAERPRFELWFLHAGRIVSSPAHPVP